MSYAPYWTDYIMAALFPAFVYALLRPKPYVSEWAILHFKAQKYLRFTGDLFLVALSLVSVAKIGFDYAGLPPDLRGQAVLVLNTTFVVLGIAMIIQHIAAFIIVRRARKV